MKNSVRKFYYSRKKLGLYLLFNIILLALAVAFTLTIFPEYPGVYIFAIGSCILSVLSALFVFLVPLPLAVITPQSIKIDRGRPLDWTDIISVRKIRLGKGLFSKQILSIKTGKLEGYRMNLMQRIAAASKFGAFSIPLYAMNKADSQEIEKVIKERLRPVHKLKAKPKTPAKKRALKKAAPKLRRQPKTA